MHLLRQAVAADRGQKKKQATVLRFEMSKEIYKVDNAGRAATKS
jgi:hypothetical protein